MLDSFLRRLFIQPLGTISDMRSFDTTVYSINDVLYWFRKNEIELQPKFQRREVWTEKAQSYLIDTIIRGKPIPKIFIRQKIDLQTKTTMREVVDGQQRLKAIHLYLEDNLQMSRNHNDDYGGLVFSELPDDVQRNFLDYRLSFDLLHDANDQEVLDIFRRLNSYSITLNTQEKRHAEFFGEFRNAVYDLARDFYRFWIDMKIFKDRNIMRMAEAEMVSDILVAMIDGPKTRKALGSYYDDYDNKLPRKRMLMKRFADIIDLIGAMLGEWLPSSNFRRPHVFYSLFCALYHFQYSMPSIDVRRRRIVKADYGKASEALVEINKIWRISEDSLNDEQRRFLTGTRRATTDGPVRIHRCRYICEVLSRYLRS
jgi:hypothetical protein